MFQKTIKAHNYVNYYIAPCTLQVKSNTAVMAGNSTF